MLADWWWGLVGGWLKCVGALPTNGRGNTGLIWSKNRPLEDKTSILTSNSHWASKTFQICLWPLRRCHFVLSSSTYESVKSCEHGPLLRWSIYFHSLHNAVLRRKKRSQHISIIQPTFCIMSLCVMALSKRYGAISAEPALLCSVP